MALVACSECGRDISTKASACPNCGAPSVPTPNVALATSRPALSRRPLIVAGVVATVALVGGGLTFIRLRHHRDEEARIAKMAADAELAEAERQRKVALEADQRREEERAAEQRREELRQAELEAVALAEEKQATAAAARRHDVVANPTRWLQTSGLQIFNKGILNSYRQMQRMTVTNTSAYPLRDLQGTIDWLDGAGASTGTTPFAIEGALPAGDSKAFSTFDRSLSSGTVESRANTVRITFTHAAIVE